jgi:hypothetical protein
LEKIKSEKTYTLEEMEKADIIQDVIEKLFWIKITDTDFLLDLYNRFIKNIQSCILKKANKHLAQSCWTCFSI